MDQHQVEAAVSDAVAQVGDSVDELIGKTGKTMQEKIDQAKPALRDLQERRWIRQATWFKKRRSREPRRQMRSKV